MKAGLKILTNCGNSNDSDSDIADDNTSSIMQPHMGRWNNDKDHVYVENIDILQIKEIVTSKKIL